MSEETIALAIGSLFLLIAIVGGGFTIERAQIPQVPTWARIVSSIIGVAFIGFFGYASLDEDRGVTVVGRSTDGVVQQPPTVDAPPPGDGVHQDAGPHPSPAGLELSDLVATWDDPFRVNDTVAVRYRLTNASDGPIELDYTFIGVRDPADTNRDKEVDPPATLQAGALLDVQTTLLLDQEGVWTIWPCFGVAGGVECPDEWRSFELAVTGE
jgi:hypothetical protein